MFTNHSHTARPASAVQTHTNMISVPKSLKSKSGNTSSFQGLEKEKKKKVKSVTIKGCAKKLISIAT